MKHKLEKEKRSGLILFITGLIILLSTIVWAIVWSLDLGIYVLAMGYPVIYFGVFWLFVFFVGIYTLFSSPRTKGLLLFIIGSLLTGGGLYYTINILLNWEILKFEPLIIIDVIIPIIIGIIIIIFGIKLIRMKTNCNLVWFMFIEYYWNLALACKDIVLLK